MRLAPRLGACYNQTGTKGGGAMDALCESCMHYTYDDEWECFTCEMEFDEDDMSRFYASGGRQCPFYRFGDEYQIVKKQM